MLHLQIEAARDIATSPPRGDLRPSSAGSPSCCALAAEDHELRTAALVRNQAAHSGPTTVTSPSTCWASVVWRTFTAVLRTAGSNLARIEDAGGIGRQGCGDNRHSRSLEHGFPSHSNSSQLVSVIMCAAKRRRFGQPPIGAHPRPSLIWKQAIARKMSEFLRGLECGPPQSLHIIRGLNDRGGGEDGIRTRDTLLAYIRLAGERLRPLGHLSTVPTISGADGAQDGAPQRHNAPEAGRGGGSGA